MLKTYRSFSWTISKTPYRSADDVIRVLGKLRYLRNIVINNPGNIVEEKLSYGYSVLQIIDNFIYDIESNMSLSLTGVKWCNSIYAHAKSINNHTMYAPK